MVAAVADERTRETMREVFEDEENDWYDLYDNYVEEEEYESALNEEDKVYTTPSRFVEYGIRIPVGGAFRNFDFGDRRYLKTIYNSPAKRKVLMCGRQTEKSTMLGNIALAYMSMVVGFRALYVSPSHTQTKTFSRDRIKEPIETSSVLRSFTSPKLLSNVLEKKFLNRSSITLRFAFLNADRVRGIPADLIDIDEFQDIILDNVPVIEECASHSEWKLFNFSGTPKSMDGSLEYYWARYSTQNEWVVPCKRHGTPKDSGSWHWNVLREENIGREGLICDRCGKSISAADPDARWASMNPHPNVEEPYEGYRIPQLMVPWIGWKDILHKQRLYSRAKFYNEVLGRSYDSGTRPLTRQDMIDNCNEELSMKFYEDVIQETSTPVFMGVDWGTGEGTYTVVTLGGYMPWDPDRFTFFYLHRFEGLESDPRVQIKKIVKLARKFKVRTIGVDYGGGFWPNDELIRIFGSEKIMKYQWLGRVNRKIRYEAGLGVPRFLCHRTEVLSDIFNAIKRRDVFAFPRWEEMDDPYAMDFLNIFSEYSETLRQNVYKHAPGSPDDTAHACTYGFLASFVYRKRPDVILPQKEAQREHEYDEEEDLWDIKDEYSPSEIGGDDSA
jgi:hypothetical protein